MATSHTSSGVTTITCKTCNFSVAQQPGSRRTICPHCGNFYDPRAAAEARLRVRRPRPDSGNEKLPQLDKHDKGKEKQGGAFQSIANFFSNLGSSKKSKQKTSIDSGENSTENSKDDSYSSSSSLPPISHDSRGKLTVTPSDSSSKKERHDGRSPMLSARLSPSANKVVYPVRTKTKEQLQSEIESATASGNWKEVHQFYATTFDSFLEINAAFKVFYLIDEGHNPGKGANATISMLHHHLETYGLGETDANIHFDNCVGQNLNNPMMWYLLWRCMTGRHQTITVNTMVTGHTKFAPDWFFGLFKRRWKVSVCSTLDHICDVVNRCTRGGQCIPVKSSDVFFYQWSDYLCQRDPNKEYKSTDDPGLKMEFLNTVYDMLIDLPQEIQKVVLKAIINSLLKDKRLSDTSRKWPHTKDDLRGYLILIQNPQFSNTATYVIFAHLLRQMASLSDNDHHFLVHWFKILEKERFKKLVAKLQHFISCRLFPPNPQDLPPMSKCSWWIPSATKVLALLNAANNMCNPPLISYMDYYNHALDNLDVMAEYYAWQNPSTHPGFTFCQYPFILSIAAKRTILQRDSEQQMIIMARRSLVAKVQRRQLPDIGMLFLNLTVRRSHLVSDSLNEIARKQHDLKKKLKVTFEGEPGLDMGGLTKEWFLLLIRQIFRPEYGMFTYDKQSNVFWFSSAPCDNYQEFNLVGVLMGLAVYNSINLDIRFPQSCYKKLLSPAVVPYNNPSATVGVAPLTLDDLAQVMPGLAQGLKDLLEYDGDVEDDFCMTFQVSVTEFGQTRTHNLKPGGDKIPVTNENRETYVKMYIDWLLNKSIYLQFQAFYHGFHSVCASNALIMLRPEEVEMLVLGSPDIDMSELKKVTTYDGYRANDPPIVHFWDIVMNMSKEMQKRLLLFTTGSDRIPVGGMGEMQFKITRVDGRQDMLPMSHTCFNQLVLPAYKSKKMLKQKLVIAVQNAEGFGIE